MELRKRQAKILQDLFEKKRISVDTILDEYGISKRTLYYDLNKINDWLSEDNFGMKRKCIRVQNTMEVF